MRTILENINKIIHEQIHDNSDLNLFFEDLENEITINKTFKEKIIKIKQNNKVDINQMIKITTKAVIAQFYMINQYIQLTSQDEKELGNIYYETYNSINNENFERIMKIHFRRIASWLSKFYPSHFIHSLSKNSRIGKVVNKEYSVSFQTNIFDIDFDKLQEPIIDIGCGKNANLVKELLRRNKTVLGIDRIVNHSNDYIKEISWFDFNFEENKWGTIIANMSFTNNLLYSIENHKNLIYNYYIKYKQIIKSLKIGGCFYYAPSLNFIEDRLDLNDYIVNRRVINGIGVTKLTKNGQYT